MEPVSQALLGGAVGGLVAGKALGRRAIAFGALVGILPDLDVLLGGLDEGFGEMLYHRGSSHALWFGPVVGPLLGRVLRRLFDSRARTPLSAWTRLCVWALFTHPLLDVFTPYGTQLLAPFDRTRFAWHGIGIIDPFYTLMLLGGVLLLWMRPAAKGFGQKAALLCIALSTLYLAGGTGLNALARADAARTLRVEAQPARLAVYPTFLQPLLRRVTLKTETQGFSGWYSALRPGCVHGLSYAIASDPRIEDLKQDRRGKLFTWFALGDIAGNVEEAVSGEARVTLDDLRYAGFFTPPQYGAWGIAADYDAGGQRRSPITRFYRPVAMQGGIDALWRATLGDFSGIPGATLCRKATPGEETPDGAHDAPGAGTNENVP